MDSETSAPLERSVSQQSAASVKSYRSATVRAGKRSRLVSQPSSSASSIAASDKSLVSFPSFSPDSPRDEPPFSPGALDGPALLSPKSTDPHSIVDSQTGTTT